MSQKAKIFWAGFLMASVGCVGWFMIHRATQAPVVDLSVSRNLDGVGWPPEERREAIWTRRYNGRLIVRFDPNHTFEGAVVWASFRQSNGVISCVELALPDQSAKDAFETSVRLAKQWNVSTEPLEKWYERDLAGQHDVVAARRNDLPNQPSIEIRSSFQRQKPYWILYSVYW